jgi:Ala-tRNA(Pro) deacylase
MNEGNRLGSAARGAAGIQTRIGVLGVAHQQEVAMSISSVSRYLDEQHVPYRVLPHAPAFTARSIAAAAHVPDHEMIKTVMALVDGRMVMAVLTAEERLDLDGLRRAAGAKSVTIASEYEFARLFQDCEPGAMPPFGNLYGVEVYADDALREDDGEIVFNAGTHDAAVRVAYRDFERLVHPKVSSITQH